MNLNANKLPILIPSNSSSNINATSQHESNQSLNIPEQSSRTNLPLNSNTNESSLLMCGPNTHNNTPFTPLYANTASPLPNAGAGK